METAVLNPPSATPLLTAPPAAGPGPVLLTCALCQDELRSARTGRLTVCDLAYVWPAATLPLRIDLDVVSLWWIRSCTKPYHFMTRLRDLDGGVLDLVESELAFETPSVHEHMAHFAALEFKTPGIYRVEVLVDDDLVGTYPLFVQVAETNRPEAG